MFTITIFVRKSVEASIHVRGVYQYFQSSVYGYLRVMNYIHPDIIMNSSDENQQQQLPLRLPLIEVGKSYRV